MSHYDIRCLATGQSLEEDGLILANPNSPEPALIRAIYDKKQLTKKTDQPGIFQYKDWLPVRRTLPSPGAPVTYQSERLAEHLGLKHLFITFSGYWPKKGATMNTATFKECEAYSVCARLPEKMNSVLVVASAGNTARAFLNVASKNRIPLVVVVPELCLGELWQDEPLNPWVRVVVASHDSDYFDAIQLSDQICALEGYQPEGGAKNIARRDGMGTTVLSAVTTIGSIPDYYFQAIGSGTGAIAAYEANLRLLSDQRWGEQTMRLFLSQNKPFQPIHDAWQKKSRDIEMLDPDRARELTRQIKARVLANRKPPYSLVGGLYDALTASRGDVMAVDNTELEKAQALFEDLEGCDICPEAGVALASLIQKIEDGTIGSSDTIMLNITGGGLTKLAESQKQPVEADAIMKFQKMNDADFKALFSDLKDELLGYV